MFIARCAKCGWERLANGPNHAIRLETAHRSKNPKCKEQA